MKGLTAGGAVLLRGAEQRRRVLVVPRPAYDDWTLPKGKPRADEPLPATAVREVREGSEGVATASAAPRGCRRLMRAATQPPARLAIAQPNTTHAFLPVDDISNNKARSASLLICNPAGGGNSISPTASSANISNIAVMTPATTASKVRSMLRLPSGVVGQWSMA